MSIERNKDVVRRLFDECVNARNIGLVDELVTHDIVIHTPVPGVASGRDGFRDFLRLFLEAFPEQHTDVQLMMGEGDLVAAVHTHRVSHGGPFFGSSPTGRSATIGGIEIYRVTGGRIAEMWHQDDLFSLVTQLGLFAPVAATAGA